MSIIILISLIIGIFLIIGTGLFAFKSKQNHPENEVDYGIVLYVYFFGILFIICAVTALTGFTEILLFIGALILYYYGNHKRYEKYLKYPVSPISRALRNLLLLCSVFLLSAFLFVVLVHQP